MRHFVVGDLHGCSDQLRVLLEHRELYARRRSVFLGDYADVGPDTPGVVDLLLEHRDKVRDVIFLQGNHDAALLDYFRTGDFASYAEIGGIATIRAYCGDVRGDVHAAFQSCIPRPHRAFFEELPPYFETEDCLFSHCGYRPEAPNDRTAQSMVRESHQLLFQGQATLGKVAVCGHYFQHTTVPYVTKDLVCLDTGCGIIGGPLSAILLPEFRVIQVRPDLSVSIADPHEFGPNVRA